MEQQGLRSKMLNPNDPLMKKVIAAMQQSGKPPRNKKGPQKGKPKGVLKNRNNNALIKQEVTTKDSDDSEA
jgi:hypothetical protein